jgi:hypothetical protein
VERKLIDRNGMRMQNYWEKVRNERGNKRQKAKHVVQFGQKRRRDLPELSRESKGIGQARWSKVSPKERRSRREETQLVGKVVGRETCSPC